MGAQQMMCAAGVLLGLAACTAQLPAVEVAGVAAPALAGVQSEQVAATAAEAAAGPVITSLADTTEVATRFGTVAVFRNEDEGISYLSHNGDASMLGVEMDHVGLVALVRWADRDAVMFESDCSGSSCGWPNYGLLELREGAAPQLLETGGLGFIAADMHSGRDEAMAPVLSVQNDGSVLIGTAGDARNWFVYRPGQLQQRR